MKEAGRLRSWHQPALNFGFTAAPAALAIVGALVVLPAFNAAILRKERLLHAGRMVRRALAPVDPGAFMAGDYLALDSGIAIELGARLAAGGDKPARDAFAIVAADTEMLLVRLLDDSLAALPAHYNPLPWLPVRPFIVRTCRSPTWTATTTRTMR